MFKVLFSNTCRKVLCLHINNNVFYRTLLTDAYKCTTSWNNRLATQVLKNVDPDELYYEIENNLGKDGKATAIDVDIYANSVKHVDHLESLADLLHKLRLSSETSNALDSTSHAVIRLFHECDQHEELLKILNDRINYGIFLDEFTANILLDKFIESNDFTSAAKVASMLMLQEDFSNEINKSLSLHACLYYIKDPKPFEPVPEVDVSAEVKPQGKKKKDEKKIRVKFLRNEYFDDHFDLRDGSLLVGKTLHMIGQSLGQTKLGNSCSLLGLILYKKFEKAQDLIQRIDKNTVYDEARDYIKTELSTVEVNESNQQVLEAIKSSVEALNGGSGLYGAVDTIVKEAIKNQEPVDIANQAKLHEEWNKIREEKLQEQLARFQKAKVIAQSEKQLKELEAEERKLWFFENEEQLDLEIEKKRVYYPKKWFGKKKKPRAIDQDYIPPDVQKEFS